MIQYDVFIPCKPEDQNKIKFVVESIYKNLSGYDQIFVVCPEKIEFPGVVSLADHDVLPSWYKDTAKYRPGWTFQQYLKLFQPVTKDHYLVVDCDLYINKPLPLFDGDKPNFLLGRDQYADQYFQHMANFGLKRLHNYSFISEVMLFDRTIVRQFLDDQSITVDSFVEKSNKILTRTCHIGDYEFYGNMCLKYAPEKYGFRHLNALVLGRHGSWSDQEIRRLVSNPQNQSYDTIAYHTWVG